MKSTFVFAALLVAATLSAQTPPPPQPREPALVETISVTGTGDVMLTPDRVIFTVGVDTMAPVVADAVRQNNEKTTRIIAALKAAGATDRDIRTSNFSIFPQYEYVDRQRPRLTGYQVSNSITVTRNNPTEAGRLLQAAIDAGANTASGLTFTVSDQTRGREEGLKAAFGDARSKAQILAQAAGRTLGRAISITEGSAPNYPIAKMGMVANRAMAEAQMDVPVQGGTEELKFTVSVIFELR